MLLHSLVRSIEIIGEAASQISRELRDRSPGLPWADVIGMRNRLVHAYFDIDPDIVWDTAAQDLPPLVTELTRHYWKNPNNSPELENPLKCLRGTPSCRTQAE